MLTLKNDCTPRPSVLDTTKRDTVPVLLDLVEGRTEPRQISVEIYPIKGIWILLGAVCRRPEGIIGLRQSVVRNTLMWHANKSGPHQLNRISQGGALYRGS